MPGSGTGPELVERLPPAGSRRRDEVADELAEQTEDGTKDTWLSRWAGRNGVGASDPGRPALVRPSAWPAPATRQDQAVRRMVPGPRLRP